MFVKGNLREGARKSFIIPVRYSVSVSDMRELKRISDTGVSVDISTGGLGMLTNRPLETGYLLTFEEEIKINGITAKAAIVRWAGRSEGDKYRVGLKFV